MANLDGIDMKYTVLNNSDLKKYHTPSTINFIERVGVAINERRLNEGKRQNSYLVISTDEAYAGEVIEILKRNGHWD